MNSKPFPSPTSRNRLLPTAYCLLFLLLLTVPLSSCKPHREPGTLVVAIEILPRGFDPRFSTNNTYSARIMQLIYDTLLVKDNNFELTPSLAEKFEESTDHQTFTFHLRPNVKFHNGKALTSADVKYTFTSLLSPELKSPIRGSLDKISSIETPDPVTVIFKASEPYYTFLGNLPAIGIIPDGAGDMSKEPLGSGPYKFVSYNEGDLVKLEANPDYWGGAPQIPRVHVKFVADNGTRQAELMGGDVDIAYNTGFDPETIRALRGRRGIQIVEGEGVNIDYLGVNFSSTSPMANARVRQAVAYAIDRDVIIDRLLRNQAVRANAILPTTHWAYEKNVAAYDHNVERAKQLLDEAGFRDPDGDGPRSRLDISLMTNTTQITRNIASVMKEQLRQVGINLELESYEFATLLDKVTKGQFDMYYLRVIGANHNTDVFQFIYHSRYQNSEFNEAIAKLRQTSEVAQMRPLLEQIASALKKHDYCPNAEVDGLVALAESSSTSEVTRKQYDLKIASMLTDRGGQNRMRYCNPQVDRWTVEAERVNDRAAKISLFSKIQQQVAEDLPQIYLWYMSNVLAASSRVGNIQLDQYGSWYFIPKLTLNDK